MTSSFLTGHDDGTVDTHRFVWLLALRRRLIDLVGNLDAFSHSAKRRKLSIKMMSITKQYKKVRGGAVCFLAFRHRDDPANMFDQPRLVRKFTRHPPGQIVIPLFTGGEIAPLNDEVFDGAAKGCGVERAC